MTDRPMAKPTKILVVEDNPGDVRLIRLALMEARNWQTDVSLARDGEQAIAMSQQEDLDLVILDYNLPKRSGIDVLRSIRANGRVSKLPVIVLSSSPGYFLRGKLQDACLEAAGYLTKPADFEEFLQLGEQIHTCYRATVNSRQGNDITIA